MLRFRHDPNYYTTPHNHGLPFHDVSAELRPRINVGLPDEAY